MIGRDVNGRSTALGDFRTEKKELSAKCTVERFFVAKSQIDGYM